MITKSIAAALGKFASSMVWLGFLYAGLLYVAVGALGVSEIVSQFGDQAVYIFHTVSVVDEVRQQRMQDIERRHARLTEISKELPVAVAQFRGLGIEVGLPLEKIQPIIDTYSAAPRLDDLLGKPVETAVELDWATRMAKVMNMQRERDDLTAQNDKDWAFLRKDWANEIPANTDQKDALTTTEIETAASTAATLRRLGYGTLFSLPSQILTLVLALSMGALGSTLSITKMLLDDKVSQSVSWFVVRPFQGMVTALVVFVLLKAGQLTISSGGGDGLNNFFVAFVGIVSGLMSLEAYHMIEKAAASIIPPDTDGETRWAFKLKDAMAAANIDAETLAAGIGSTPAEVKAWMAETASVPPLQQQLIAVWLHQPMRDLFTSQAPADVAVAQAPLPAEAAPPPAPAPA